MPSLSVLAAGLVSFAVAVSGHQKYVALNPNGANVHGDVAIGHTNPTGGGKTNAYGSDFDKIGKKE